MTTFTDGHRTMGRREFIAILALLMSTSALSIDIMLPAFTDIRAEFGLAVDSNAVAGLVTAYFLGLAVSQIFYGLLADRFGRKPMIYGGLVIYIAGATASLFAPTFSWLLAARFVWGVGAAGPRVVTLSVVRDTHKGEQMAKVMSLIMAVFILVPIVAPTIGAVLTNWISWRGAFGFVIVFAVMLALWANRLPETLKTENRLELTFRDIARAGRFVLTTRQTVGFMLALTVLFGSFISYIATSQLIFSDIYDLEEIYPYIFGALGILMGIGSLTNSRLVERVGLHRLIDRVILMYLLTTVVFMAVAIATSGTPPLWFFLVGIAAVLVSHALLMPNLNTGAMIPMGAVAGTASAVIGTVTTGLGSLVGSSIDRAYNGTVTPLAIGFVIFASVAWGFCRWAASGSRKPAGEPAPAPAE